MKTAVIGSRGFNQEKLLFDTLDNLKVQVPSLDKIDLIISGGALGADSMAEEYARSSGIKTQIFLPDYKQFGRGAPLKRNIQIVEAADLVVAFWDGKSRGTLHAINEATKRKKKVIIVEF